MVDANGGAAEHEGDHLGTGDGAGESGVSERSEPWICVPILCGHAGSFNASPSRIPIRPDHSGAGGGTRTHTTLPSRDFKSLASTSSATSASLILHNFLPLPVQLVSRKSFDVSKT